MRLQGLLFHDTELMEQKDLNKDVPKDATARNKELLIMIGWGNNSNTVNRQTKQDGTGTGCVMKPADKIRRQQWAVGITGTAISNMTCAVRDRGPLQSNTSGYLPSYDDNPSEACVHPL